MKLPDTSTDRATSYVVKAVATVLKTVLGLEHVACHAEGSSDTNVRVLSYRDDFEFLWAVGDDDGLPQFFNGNVDDGVVIIVWDTDASAPRSTISDLSKYLTPLDWVVWYTLTMADRSFVDGIPRIFLLDLDSLTATEADSVKFFDLFPNRSPAWMPWLRSFRIAPTKRDQLCFKDLLLFVVSRMQYCNDRPDLESLRRIWRGAFLRPTEPSDHHAIANVVGPSLLLQDEGNDPRRQALETFLRRLALLPQQSTQDVLGPRFAWIDWSDEPWKTAVDRIKSIDRRPLNFLLVDDVAIRHGWGKVVAYALGLPYQQPNEPASIPQLIADGTAGPIDARLYATESASGFLEAICDGAQEASELTPMRFVLKCNLVHSDAQSTREPIDVLMLDLRLFQGQDLAAECRFFRQLIDYAKRFCDDDETNEQLPWPGFTSTELSTIEAWLTRVEQRDKTTSQEDTEYLQGLTLLPRLISLLDFSLPIIFFSSTDRRQIVNVLKPYRNIITHFDKPRLQLGQDVRIAEEFAEKFRAALADVLHMSTARRLCSGIVARPPAVDWDFYRARLPATAADGVWRAHLMLDETGPPNSKPQTWLKVGGLLAIYPPGQDPDAFSDAVVHQFPEIRTSKNFTRRNLEAIAQAVDALCIQRRVLVVPISLTGNLSQTVYSDVDKSDELHDERVGDNLHRELVRCVTELAIYCVARQILPANADVEISVMAATRVKPSPDDRTKKALWDRWGVATDYVGDGKLYSAKKIIERIIRRHAGNPVFNQGVIDTAKTLCADIEAADRLPEAAGGMASATRNEVQKQMVQYFDKNDARPVVEEIMREYRHSSFEPPADIVRAFSLNAFGTKEADQIHALHFLSDALLGATSNGQAFQNLNGIAIDGRYGERLVTLLESHRFAVRGQLAQSLAHGGTAGLGDRKNEPATSVVVCDLIRAAQELSGTEYMGLVALLSDASLLPQPSISVRQGTVVRKHDTGLHVRDSKREYYANHKYCLDFTNTHEGDPVTFVAVRQIGMWLARKVKRASP